jgi:hypothetical protein
MNLDVGACGQRSAQQNLHSHGDLIGIAASGPSQAPCRPRGAVYTFARI